MRYAVAFLLLGACVFAAMAARQTPEHHGFMNTDLTCRVGADEIVLNQGPAESPAVSYGISNDRLRWRRRGSLQVRSELIRQRYLDVYMSDGIGVATVHINNHQVAIRHTVSANCVACLRGEDTCQRPKAAAT